MAKYLFIFEYETPVQTRDNEEQGRSHEGSIAFFIEADSETDADEWGKVVAQMFLNALYENEYEPPQIAAYYNGIEKNPEGRFDPSELSQAHALSHGNIEELENAVEAWLSNLHTAQAGRGGASIG